MAPDTYRLTPRLSSIPKEMFSEVTGSRVTRKLTIPRLSGQVRKSLWQESTDCKLEHSLPEPVLGAGVTATWGTAGPHSLHWVFDANLSTTFKHKFILQFT